jgi:rSAM/selenodomain-associated transferase 2
LDKKYSFILPVLNEAAIINATLDHLKALEGSDQCEYIVVDGTPDGSTIKTVAGRDALCMTSPRGRALQMNTGAAAAKGDILIFLHADTLLPRNALRLIARTMTRQGLVGGAFDLRIGSERWMLRIIAWIASMRSRLTKIPYGDQAIFIRTDYFERVGRYPEIPLMEDVALMRSIKRAGGMIGFIPEPVTTSARRWEEEGILYGTLRNWLLVSAYLLGVSPERLVKYYRSGQG